MSLIKSGFSNPFMPSSTSSITFDPNPAGFNASAEEQQAAGGNAMYDVQNHQGGWGTAAGIAGAAAGMGLYSGLGKATNRLTSSGNKWVRGVGELSRLFSIGAPGVAARGLASLGLTGPMRNIKTYADYVAAKKPGFWGNVARAPLHVIPDWSTPNAKWGFWRQKLPLMLAGGYGFSKLDDLTGAKGVDENGNPTLGPTWANRLDEYGPMRILRNGATGEVADWAVGAPMRAMNTKVNERNFQKFYNTRLAQEVREGDRSRQSSSLPLAAILALVLGMGSKSTLGSWLPGIIGGIGAGGAFGAGGRSLTQDQKWNGDWNQVPGTTIRPQTMPDTTWRGKTTTLAGDRLKSIRDLVENTR